MWVSIILLYKCCELRGKSRFQDSLCNLINDCTRVRDSCIQISKFLVDCSRDQEAGCRIIFGMIWTRINCYVFLWFVYLLLCHFNSVYDLISVTVFFLGSSRVWLKLAKIECILVFPIQQDQIDFQATWFLFLTFTHS